MKKSHLILLAFTFLLSNNSYAQKFKHLVGDFTLIEKKTNGEKNSLIMGKIDYNSSENTSNFDIFFPEKETWVLQDSFLSKYQDSLLKSTINVGQIGDEFIFKSILSGVEKDFGLTTAGFAIGEIREKSEDVIEIHWIPSELAKSFIKEAITEVKENLLHSIKFVDINDLVINETYFEEYVYISGIAIPIHISSKYQSSNETLFKVLKLKNVTIQ